jgi:hypothetical protein
MPKKTGNANVGNNSGRNKQKIEQMHAAMMAAKATDRELRIARNSARQKEAAAAARAAMNAKDWAPGDDNLVLVKKKSDFEKDDYSFIPRKKKTHRSHTDKDFTLLRTKAGKSTFRRSSKAVESKGAEEDFPEIQMEKLTPVQLKMQAKLRAENDRIAREAHGRMCARRMEAELKEKQQKLAALKKKFATNPRHMRKMEKLHRTVPWAHKQITTFNGFFEKWVNKIGDGETSPHSISGALHGLLEKANGVKSRLDNAISDLGEGATDKEHELVALSEKLVSNMNAAMEEASEDLTVYKKQIKTDVAAEKKRRSEHRRATHVPDTQLNIGSQVKNILEARCKRSFRK